MTRRLTSALVVLLVGVALLELSTGQTWSTVRLGGSAPANQVRGNQELGGFGALALAGLAAGAAVLATRGTARRLLGLAVVAVGVVAALRALHGQLDRGSLARSAPSTAPVDGLFHVTSTGYTVWPLVAILAGLVMAAAGLLIVAAPLGGGLSGRHERPGPTGTVAGPGADATPGLPAPSTPVDREVAAWRALDGGEDPTDLGP